MDACGSKSVILFPGIENLKREAWYESFKRTIKIVSNIYNVITVIIL